MKKILPVLLAATFLVSCGPAAVKPTLQPTFLPATTSPTPSFRGNGLWISSGVPEALRQVARGWGIPIVSDFSQSSVRLDVADPSSTITGQTSVWTYALVSPFPTVTDDVTSDQLRGAWRGASSGAFSGKTLWMADSTLAAFTALWDAPAPGAVQTAPSDQLLDLAWKNMPSWAIVPFESLEPRWKVLTVDLQSPIRKDFDPSKYPLQVRFSVLGANLQPSEFNLPAANRDSFKMTTVILTGTTSLVRGIAYQMEVKGIDYPATDIGGWLRQADILHVSNKTSFDPSCPPPNPLENKFYCSDPRYIGLLIDVGVKVVELTGPHILDDGVNAFLYTLNLYKQNHLQYYGGGANFTEARKPLLIENHGNKIAFVGCNAGEPPRPLATDYSPGANPCDYKQLTAQIGQLRAQGYLPIVTIQYKEGYSPQVMPWQLNDYRKAADAGAVIVSGSQAHAPLEMEFHNGTFIHYGLGNLFFDQMGNQPPNPGMLPQPAQRYEFIDRHVFYDGRYISTELLTAMLEDYARPRPMTSDERATFLTTYFGYSGWLPLIPTPAPEQTPTLYPLFKNFIPISTHTPVPSVTPTP